MRPAASFDHLVGASEDRWRHGEAERLGGVQIDHQLEGGRLLDRQSGGLGALENPSGVDADLAKDSCLVNSIADQAAPRDEWAVRIDRWNNMARCQRHELLYPAAEEHGVDNEGAGLQLDEGGESGVDLAFGTSL